ncbi:hypothetical protein I9192_15925 [Acinetobacter bereziniae]|nr:hypothetical protein I9192_15925 [Acinetobacter bereziniae]
MIRVSNSKYLPSCTTDTYFHPKQCFNP